MGAENAQWVNFTENENPDEKLLRLIRKLRRGENLINNYIESGQSGIGSGGVSRGVNLTDTSTTILDVIDINLPDGALTDEGGGEGTIDLVISAQVPGDAGGSPFSGAVIYDVDDSILIVQSSGVFTFSTSADIIPQENEIGVATWTTVQDSITVYGSAGLIEGGALSDGGGGTIDVAELTGMIRSTDSHTGDLFPFDFAGSTGHMIPVGTNQWIGIEYNAGTPQVVVKATDDFNGHDEFALGCVTNESGTLHVISNPSQISNFGQHALKRFYETAPMERANRFGGIIISETGTRNVTVTEGSFFDRFNKFLIDAIDTSGADNFDSYSSAGLESSADTQWDNLQYDNAGTLTTLTNAKYANLWFYIELDGFLVCVYGTAQYNTLATALLEGTPSVLPNRILCHGTLIGRIVFQKSDTTAQLIQSAFEATFSGTGVSDHNNLGGLNVGDYLHLTAAEYDKIRKVGTETSCPAGQSITISLGAISDDAIDRDVYVKCIRGDDIFWATSGFDTAGQVGYTWRKRNGNLEVDIFNNQRMGDVICVPVWY